MLLIEVFYIGKIECGVIIGIVNIYYLFVDGGESSNVM